MEIILANPRGFCAGVERAIAIVEKTIKLFNSPIYVHHEVVHNNYVVDNFKKRGVIFIEDLNEVPQGSVLIFSAHGVAKKVAQNAEHKKFRVFDATCPLVTKVHKSVHKHQKNNTSVILIGHAGHPEVEGTMGQDNKNSKMYLVQNEQDVQNLKIAQGEKVAYVSQTTLSVDDTKSVISSIKSKIPNVIEPNVSDICYATQNRQNAVKDLMQKACILFVLGSKNSSNSNRLKEIALKMGKRAYLIDNADMIETQWLKNIKIIGLTAGASAPEVLIQQTITKLKSLGASSVVEGDGIKENIVFKLPRNLRAVENN